MAIGAMPDGAIGCFATLWQKDGAITKSEITMSRMKMLIAIAAVALGIAGAVSSAQAGSKDDDGAPVRGIKIGPLGQRFGGPTASGAFAFAPLTRAQVRAYRQLRREQAPLDEDN